jgi:methylated-DNA-[protein]-cysteine S-methyltransferase
MQQIWHFELATTFGRLVTAWEYVSNEPKIIRIELPREGSSAKERILSRFPGSVLAAVHPRIKPLTDNILDFLKGEEAKFDLNLIALERCPEFQRKVILAEYGIPRGYVSTYGRIAEHLGVFGGARAIGNSLASNPFPIVIPCHRAGRSDGGLGGYQGGLKMKRKLLEMEGVMFTPSGKVVMNRVYY